MPNAHSGAPRPGARESARVLAQAGWSQVLDSVLRGLRHDLNSRLASLDAIVMLNDLGDLEQPLAATVAPELEGPRQAPATSLPALRDSSLPARCLGSTVAPLRPASSLRRSVTRRLPFDEPHQERTTRIQGIEPTRNPVDSRINQKCD